MKPVAVFLLVAVFSLTTVAVSAKTVTMPAKNADEQSVIGVAGPAPKPVADKSSAQPSKAALKKSKVKTPPPMHDPN